MKFIKFAEQKLAVNEVTAYNKNGRSILQMAFESDYQTLRDAFVDDVVYAVEEHSFDEEGKEVINEYDKTDYCLVLEITDYCNGKLRVTMGKKTANELLEEENAELMFELLTGEEF